MATNDVSDITSGTIDGEFPVPGVDNDTQGFRDNFSIIKNNFETAKQEITDLYQRTPKLDKPNNFNGTIIAESVFQATRQAVFSPGSFNQTVADIDFTNGHYQVVGLNEIINNGVVTNDIEISLTGWPESDHLSKMTIQLKSNDSQDKIVRWVTLNGTLMVSSNWPTNTNQITVVGNPDVEDESVVLVEFWTYNSGNTVYANYLGIFNEL